MNLGMENEATEHKRSTSEMREGMESVASILNKHGHGTLYFGVRPSDGEVVGQDVSEKTLRDISQAFTNRIEPHVIPTIERLVTEDGKSYIRVAFSGDERPYACDGRYRVRSADEDLPMGAAALEAMMLERISRKRPWDRRSSGCSVADVDEDVLRSYVERGVEHNRIPFGYTDARDVLARLGLLCDDGTLTNAAAVCFVPSRDIMLRMGVLADAERLHILDNHQEAGTLFSLVDAAEIYILNNTRRAFVIDGTSLHRREVPEIPLSAIREALLNAFCHRDYEDLGAVQIDIFWDAVDIYNPGSFPPGLTPSDYLVGDEVSSKSRNQLIAQTLYRAGDIETYGTGLRRIKDACDSQGVPVEVFQRGSCVHVRFTRSEALADKPVGDADNSSGIADKRVGVADKPSGIADKPSGVADNHPEIAGDLPDADAPDWTGLPESERRACEFLAANGEASVTKMSEALGLPSRTLRAAMRRLVDKGIAVAEGANRNRTYRLR